MKKIILSSCLLLSFSFGQVNYESSILNHIKEEVGIKDTKEEVYFKFLKTELNKYFKYYVKSKKIKKTDEQYQIILDKLNSLRTIDDIFDTSFINKYLLLSNKFMGHDKVYVSDLIFKLSVREKGTQYLSLFINNLKDLDKVMFNYDYSSLEEEDAKQKIHLIFKRLKEDENLQKKFVKGNNDFSVRNELFNIENLIKYNYFFDIYYIKSRNNDMKINYEEYKYLLKNEKKLQYSHRGIYDFYKQELERDISKKIIVKKKERIISKKSIFKIPEYRLSNLYLIEYDLEMPLLNYLLIATGPDNIYFKDYFNLYEKGVNKNDIINKYNSFYKIPKDSIKVMNIKESIISFHKGKYYKTKSKKDFNKKFLKFVKKDIL